MLERVACIRMRGKKVLEDVNIWRNMYRVVLCQKKLYRVVGVYVLFVIITN